MDHLLVKHGIPKRVQIHNGSEFISKALDRWTYDHGVIMDFSGLGSSRFLTCPS